MPGSLPALGPAPWNTLPCPAAELTSRCAHPQVQNQPNEKKMGEQYMYDEMQQEMDLACLYDESLVEEARLRTEMAAMRAFAAMPKDGFVGPFCIKDVVHDDQKKLVGKVIGLPTRDDVEARDDGRVGKAWIYFTDATREWVPFANLSMVRRSPIKRPRVDTPVPRSIQTKLFVTSRSAGLSSGSTTSPGADEETADVAPHERDRKLPSLPPAGVRGRQKSGVNMRETKVAVTCRIQQYCKDGFRDSAGKLFCGPCKCVLTNVKSSIEAHISSVKHKTNLAKFNARTSADIDLMADLATHFAANPDSCGGTNVTQNDQLFRYRVTETLLGAGIDLAKADNLRYLLGRSGSSVPSSTHLKAYVPKIEALEVDKIKEELQDEFICWIFDGTTRLGELVALVARWCSGDFYLKHRLVSLKTFKRNLNASQLRGHLTETILRRYQMALMNSVQFSRDSAAINGAAVGTLASNTFPATDDIKCFPHTLSHTGEHMEMEPLEGFTSAWIGVIYSSGQAKSIWKEIIQESVMGHSTVRWHCRAEIMMQLARHFNKIQVALRHFAGVGLAPRSLPKLTAKYEENTHHLRLQLAAMLDVQVIVDTTHALEGDGLVQMLTYERIEALRALGRRLDEPGILVNVAAVIRDSAALAIGRTRVAKHWEGFGMCEGSLVAVGRAESTLYSGERTVYTVKYDIDGTREDLEEEEIRPLLLVTSDDLAPVDGLAGGFRYLEDRLTGRCQSPYSLVHEYEVARLLRVFDPNYANAHLMPDGVTALSTIRCIEAHGLVPHLTGELPIYLSLAAAAPPLDHSGVNTYTDQLLRWWRENCPRLPEWGKAARMVFSMTTTSAASERVFSLVEAMYGHEQHSVLADQLQAAVMLRYNKRLLG